MNFKNYNFSQTKVTAIVNDGHYIWKAFLGSGGTVILRKVSAFDLDQIFYELTPPVDKIVSMKISGNFLYCVVEDGTYIALRYSTNNPLGSYNYISIPSGINEFPVDLVHDGSTYWYILLPGDTSGENAKILKYSGITLSETIDLTKSAEEIINATSIAVDSNDNLWVVTYQTPAKLVKVYEVSAGYDFESYTIF